MAQVLELTEDPRNSADVDESLGKKLTLRNSLLSKQEFKRILRPSIRSGLLGTFVGFLPGAGATAGSFLSYALEKKSNKSKVPLGEGAVEGIAASEAANNAAAAGAFGPLLSLGIPGSGTTAVLLGGLMMWGLNPGPMLFSSEPEFTWGLIASLFVSNLIALAIALCIIPWIIKLLKVPVGIMIPSIVVVCFVGSFSTSNSMFGVVVMMIGGVLGYIFKKNEGVHGFFNPFSSSAAVLCALQHVGDQYPPGLHRLPGRPAAVLYPSHYPGSVGHLPVHRLYPYGKSHFEKKQVQ